MIRKFTYLLVTAAGLSLLLAGCLKSADTKTPVEDTSIVEDSTETGDTPEVEYPAGGEDTPTAEDTSATENASTTEDTSATEDSATAEDTGETADTSVNEDAPANENVQTGTDTPEDSDAPYDVIWIGDSLTQGSLGEDNHNKDNPQAPWRVLGEISGKNVTGVGFFGYRTHDIFWAYAEYGGIKDPDITYVYWVGSNDFHDSPDNIKYVIEETDRFNTNAGITKFIMLGTTNRGDMDPNAYIGINKGLEDYYGDRYLDIMPYVEYSPDGIHLTEASYRRIAGAVYDKLRSMGYL